MRLFLIGLIALAAMGCSPTGLVIRAEGAMHAHEACSKTGGTWTTLVQEAGPNSDSAGNSTGSVSIEYECSQAR